MFFNVQGFLLGLAIGSAAVPVRAAGEAGPANDTITAIPGVLVGHHTDPAARRGCTVVMFPGEGGIASVDVRGSAPGTRETDLLDPINLVQRVHAVVLAGGSAYGLDAAGGVMRYLEERKIGLLVGNEIRVPIVPAAVLFDLLVGNPRVRPDASWGYSACTRASASRVEQGNVGAGAGATVGKALGMKYAMKGGLGSALVVLPQGQLVGALISVNALGDVVDPSTARVVAGIRGDDPGSFHSSEQALMKLEHTQLVQGSNTTIGLVVTNAPLTKTELKKVAEMAHDGLARTVRPAHTMFDGDTIFTVSVPAAPDKKRGAVQGDVNALGTAAAKAIELAILRAIDQATSIEGYPAARDWRRSSSPVAPRGSRSP